MPVMISSSVVNSAAAGVADSARSVLELQRSHAAPWKYGLNGSRALDAREIVRLPRMTLQSDVLRADDVMDRSRRDGVWAGMNPARMKEFDEIFSRFQSAVQPVGG